MNPLPSFMPTVWFSERCVLRKTVDTSARRPPVLRTTITQSMPTAISFYGPVRFAKVALSACRQSHFTARLAPQNRYPGHADFLIFMARCAPWNRCPSVFSKTTVTTIGYVIIVENRILCVNWNGRYHLLRGDFSRMSIPQRMECGEEELECHRNVRDAGEIREESMPPLPHPRVVATLQVHQRCVGTSEDDVDDTVEAKKQTQQSERKWGQKSGGDESLKGSGNDTHHSADPGNHVFESSSQTSTTEDHKVAVMLTRCWQGETEGGVFCSHQGSYGSDSIFPGPYPAWVRGCWSRTRNVETKPRDRQSRTHQWQ